MSQERAMCACAPGACCGHPAGSNWQCRREAARADRDSPVVHDPACPGLDGACVRGCHFRDPLPLNVEGQAAALRFKAGAMSIFDDPEELRRVAGLGPALPGIPWDEAMCQGEPMSYFEGDTVGYRWQGKPHLTVGQNEYYDAMDLPHYTVPLGVPVACAIVAAVAALGYMLGRRRR